MRITRIKTHRFSPAEIDKLDIALELFSHAVNSVHFKKSIEEHSPFDTVDNLTNNEIYTIIMNGDEVGGGRDIDEEADLNITMDLRNSTDAIGYTKDERIFTFQNFFQQLEPTKLAGHYAHEYCHTLGFADPSNLDELERNVPYEVGRIIEELAISNQRTFIPDEEGLTDSEKTMRRVRKTARRSKIVPVTAKEKTATRKTGTAKAKAKKGTAKKTVVKKKAVVKKKSVTKKTIRKTGGKNNS